MERIWKLPLCHCFWIMLIQYTHRWKVRVMQFEAEDRSTWYCLVRSGCTGYSLIGWRGYTGPGGLHQLHRHGWSRAPPHGGTVRLIHLLLLVKLHREMGQLENVGKSVKESSLARFKLIRKPMALHPSLKLIPIYHLAGWYFKCQNSWGCYNSLCHVFSYLVEFRTQTRESV